MLQENRMPEEKNIEVQLALINQQQKAILQQLDEMKGMMVNMALHDQRITACEANIKRMSNHETMANDHISKLSNHDSRIENCETSIKDLFNRFWAVILLVVSGAIAYFFK